MSVNMYKLCKRIISTFVVVLLLLEGVFCMNLFALNDTKNTGSYTNTKYKTSGLYNDDGELVMGVNYTPTANYGWLPTTIRDKYYNDEMIRTDLKRISSLGFNSVRLLGVIDVGMTLSSGFETTLKEIMDNYERLFKTCRDYGLTADVCMVPADGDTTDYKAEGSGIRRVLEEFVNRFDGPYDDVIVLWEVSNEPDLNTYGMTLEDSVAEFASNKDWNEKRAPYLAWCADYMRKLGAKNPISIGSMNSPRCTEWDAKNFDVANIHNYKTTVEEADIFNSEIWELDMKVKGKCRPTVLSEVGMPAGVCSPNSDIIQYCIENDIAFYTWGYAWISNEGYMQGLIDNTGNLRTSTLGYSMIQGYEDHSPLNVTAYDTTPGGRDTVDTILYGYDMGNKPDSTVEEYARSVEIYYNWVRGLVAYWTPDFRELVYQTPGDTLRDRLDSIAKWSSYAAIPYIRTYGNYTNDNTLGGDMDANYFENQPKYVGMDGAFPQGRTRFAFGMGKDGSDAILMQQSGKLMMLQPLNENYAYSISVSLKVADNSNAGIGFACQNDAADISNPGIYLSISQGESKDFAEKLVSGGQKPYSIRVSTTTTIGTNGIVASFDYDPKLIDKNGYLDIKVAFSGKGTAVNPLNAIITSNGVEIGKFEVRYGLDENCIYPCLISDTISAANYFDNLIIKNETENKVLWSDGFETGKFDYDYLTYVTDSRYTANTNSKLLDRIAGYISDLKASSVLLAAPKDMEAYICDSLLVFTWKYAGKGEGGFEIQRSLDGKTWERYWRCFPGSTNAIVPLYDNNADKYQYRVSTISSTNTAVRPSEAFTASKGEGQNGSVLASFKDKSGKEQKVIAIGNGVFIDGTGSECKDSTVDKNSYVYRYLKKTNSVDPNLVNRKISETADNTADDTNNSTVSNDKSTAKIPVLPIIIFAVSAVLLALAAVILGFTFLKKQ